MEELLRLALKQAEQAEVYRVSRRETPVSFEANRLKMLETKEMSGVALRLVKNGRTGFSATNDPGDVQGLVERAVELSTFGAVAKFSLPGPATYAPLRVYDPATEQVTVEAMVATGQRMIDAILKVNRELVCEAGVTKSETSFEISNSNGAHATGKRTGYSLGLHGTLVRGTDMLFVGEWGSSCSPDVDADAITAKVARQLELAKHTVESPSGRMTVVFTPHGVASALLSPLTIALNGKTVLQGASPLQHKMGQQVLDRRFSLWDDPTLDMRPGSRNVDDEGVPTQRLALIEAGVPKTILYDLQTAGQAGVQSTGSASRGLGSLPGPSASLLVVGAGETTYEAMIAGIEDGLVVEQLLGVGQGNVLGGEFSGNVLLGYRIQNGKITGRVKDTMVAGNVYEALNSIVALGSEREWLGGSLLTPAIACAGVSVSAKQA